MGIYFIDYENVHDEGLKGVSALNGNDTVVIFYSNNIKNMPFDLHVEITKSGVKTDYIKIGKTAKNYLDFHLASYLGYMIGTGKGGPFYIISKDTGFDSVVDLWKARGFKIERKATIATKKKQPKEKEDTLKTTPEKKPQEKAPSKRQNKNPRKQVKQETEGIETTENPVQKTEAEPKGKVQNGDAYVFPESFRKKVRTAVKNDGVVASKYSTIYKHMANAMDESDYKNRMRQVFGEERGELLFEHTLSVYDEFKNQKN